MFSLSELATLIRLVEKEGIVLYEHIQSDDECISNDAADFSVHIGLIAGKLQELYELEWQEGSNHLPYNKLLEKL
ncbi:MAG: hypothetical protein B0W54_02085 [Cellvibrio sp. 79]|nr:MAG: hypothetical protein B0W54_02085 [Cellvibrio sp. 79]